MAKKNPKEPEKEVWEHILEARRLAQLARCSSGQQGLDHWLATGLALQLASIKICECFRTARSRLKSE